MAEQAESSNRLTNSDEGDAVLEKTQSVLHLSAILDQRKLGGNSYAFFTYDDPEEAHPRLRKYEIDLESFEEMGKPEVITVTAVVGDTLNG
jgi:hypothetical protein